MSNNHTGNECGKNGVQGVKPLVDSSLMDSFIRDARKTVALLKELCGKPEWWEDEEDLLSYIITVHGIKSSLGSIGEAELSKVASKLETNGRDENFKAIGTSTPGFLEELGTLLEKLEQEFDEGTEITAHDSDDVLEKLPAVKKMCADYNRKGVLDLIASVKSCTEKTKVVLETVKEHILHSDFDEAEAEMDSYLKEIGN